MDLDELVRLAQRYRGQQPPPARIRVAPDLYERIRQEFIERPTWPTAALGASAHGIPLVIDEELPAGGWEADPGKAR